MFYGTRPGKGTPGRAAVPAFNEYKKNVILCLNLGSSREYQLTKGYDNVQQNSFIRCNVAAWLDLHC